MGIRRRREKSSKMFAERDVHRIYFGRGSSIQTTYMGVRGDVCESAFVRSSVCLAGEIK